MNKICYFIALLLFVSCTDDSEPRLDDIITTIENPPVRLYVEQFDGEQISGGEWVEVTPDVPYRDPNDRPTVYTLDPVTTISVGGALIDIQRTFDYDLQHRQTAKGRTADISYKPAETRVCNVPISGDSAHIIIESGAANLLVERDTFALELRFPALTTQHPSVRSDLQSELTQIETEFFYSGRVIAQPHPTTTCGQRTDSDSTYFYVRTALRLPYLYNAYGYPDQNFNYSFGYRAPELFGDDQMHYADVNLYGNDWGMDIVSFQVDNRDSASHFTTKKPYSIVINWNEK